MKYFLDVSQAEQRRRFEARITDPVKHWKLSPMDVESVRRWWDYTRAYQAMLEATDTPAAPWYVVPADDKRRARLNLISHMLSSIPYRKVRPDLPKIPKAAPRPKGVEEGLRAGQVGAQSVLKCAHNASRASRQRSMPARSRCRSTTLRPCAASSAATASPWPKPISSAHRPLCASSRAQSGASAR